MPPEDDKTGDVEPVVEIPDISVYEAKIEELNATVAAESARAADLESALTAAKATNYDLLMATPKDGVPPAEEEIDDVSTDVDIDDLFESGK